MRAMGHTVLLLNDLYSYDDVLLAAKAYGPDLVISYGSLNDVPSIGRLKDLDAPLIVITGFAEPYRHAAAMRPFYLIDSPWLPDKLMATVERALAESHRHQD